MIYWVCADQLIGVNYVYNLLTTELVKKILFCIFEHIILVFREYLLYFSYFRMH